MAGLAVKMRWLSWAMTAVALAVGVGVWVLFYKEFPPQVPLYYSRPWGEDQLVSPVMIFSLVAWAGGAGIVGVIAEKRIGEDRPLFLMVAVSCIVAQMIVILGLLRIVMLVG